MFVGSEDITSSLLQKSLFPTKCNKELAMLTYQYPDFEYTPSDVPEVDIFSHWAEFFFKELLFDNGLICILYIRTEKY